MTHLFFLIRRRWWKRVHPLVRIGWITATAGKRRPVTQTAIGIGLMGAGVMLRHTRRNEPIYTHTIDPGQTVRIRVYRGTNVASEAVVRT